MIHIYQGHRRQSAPSPSGGGEPTPKPAEKKGRHKIVGRANSKEEAEAKEKKLKDAGKKVFILPFTFKKGKHAGKTGYLIAES